MLRNATQLLIILSVIWTENIAIGWRNYEVVFSNALCTVYSQKVNTFNCTVHKLPNSYSALSIVVITAQDLYIKDTRSKLSLLRDGSKPMSLIDHTFDACDLLEGKSTSAGLQLVIAQLRSNKVTNLPTRCPLGKNKKYYVSNFYIDAEKLPPYTPHLKFDYYMKFYDNDTMMASLEVQGEVKTIAQITKKKRV